jgi:osmoprotectant transport system substrate-binding protein
MSRRWVVAAVLSLAVGLSACGSPATDPGESALGDDAITVGSFEFAESELLAELYSQALERGGYDVRRAFGLGPRELVGPALDQGLVEVVPEYAGTALRFLVLGDDVEPVDGPDTHRALVAALRGHPVVALAAAPAQTANTFAVTRATAERFALRALSDVVPVADQLSFGGPPECPQRPLCLAGLEQVYGLDFGEVVSLDAGDAITMDALARGVVDIALLFTTTPQLEGGDLVELDDDRGLQPSENITPLVHAEVLDRWGPDVAARLDAVSGQLTTSGLRRLNKAVAEGASPASVAAGWLAVQGIR